MGWGTTWGTVWGGSAMGGGPVSPLGPFVAAIERGEAGRIRPDGWIAPENEFVFCLGSDAPGRKDSFRVGDQLIVRQAGDFDTTKLLRARVKTRGIDQIPAIVRVTSAATGDYTITINGTDYTYAANTGGKSLGSGTGASVVSPPYEWLGLMVSVDGMSGIDPDEIARGGLRLLVSGAAIPGNNGTFPIGTAGQGFVDDTEVLWRNPSGVAGDANNGALDWNVLRIPDDVTRIAIGLAQLINEGDQAVHARVQDDDSIEIERDDPDADLVVTLAGNLSLAAVWWRASLEIDGERHWQDVIDVGRVRDLFDVGALIVPLAAGSHDLEFKLTVEGNATGAFELELPAVYVDALVFAEEVVIE